MPTVSVPAPLTPPAAAPVCSALPTATQFTDLARLGQGRTIPGLAAPELPRIHEPQPGANRAATGLG